MPTALAIAIALGIGIALYFFSEKAQGSVNTSSDASGAGGGWSPPARAQPYLEAIAAAEARYNLPRNLEARALYQESRFRPEIIDGSLRSSAGAIGIAQFLPQTAADLGIDPLDPFQSIDGMGRYLRQLYLQFGSWDLALAAYNWGPGNLTNKGAAAAPAETVAYVSGILGDVGLA